VSEEIPPTRTIFDLLTRIDNLLEIQIKTTRKTNELLERTNELLEMLLGIRPAPPEVVVVPPAPPAVPPIVQVELKAMHDILDRIEETLKPVTDYLSEEKSAPQFYDLEEELRRPALNGFIANAGPGDLEVKINNRDIIRVASGEILDFTAYFKRPLEINYVELTSPTTATFRILLW